MTKCVSPRYNHAGWLGVKHQFTDLPTQASQLLRFLLLMESTRCDCILSKRHCACFCCRSMTLRSWTQLLIRQRQWLWLVADSLAANWPALLARKVSAAHVQESLMNSDHARHIFQTSVHRNWSDSHCNWSVTVTAVYTTTACTLSHTHTHTHTKTHTEACTHARTHARTHNMPYALCLSAFCFVVVVLLLLFLLLLVWELVKQNDSQYVWLITDFHPLAHADDGLWILKGKNSRESLRKCSEFLSEKFAGTLFKVDFYL